MTVRRSSENEYHQIPKEENDKKEMPTVAIHVLALALCLSSGFQQGYIASVLNQPYEQIEIYINQSFIHRTGSPINGATLDLMWSLLNVCFPIATIFGQFAAAFLVARLGRKSTALIACALYFPGTLLSASAKWIPNAFELLYVGRIIWSFANGIASVNATVWIVECAPPAIRGRMAAMQEVFMAIGALLTQALGVPFSTANTWPFMFLPNIVIVTINIALFFVVYESPQFLIEKKGNYDMARKALSAYHGVAEDDESLDEEIRICEEAIKKKKADKEKAKQESTEENTGPTALQVMFMPWKANDPASRIIRQNAWIGLMVKVAYVFTGARCLRAYSSFVLHELGGWSMKAANIGSLINSILRLPMTMMPVLLVDRIGRRPLMLTSTLVSLVALILMEVAVDIGPSWKIVTMVTLSALLLTNACGLGSISRFYCAELVPRSVLLQSVSVLTALEATSKIGVEFAWYPLANLIDGQALLLFSVPTGLSLFLMWWLCPETSKKSVTQVLNETAENRKLDVTF